MIVEMQDKIIITFPSSGKVISGIRQSKFTFGSSSGFSDPGENGPDILNSLMESVANVTTLVKNHSDKGGVVNKGAEAVSDWIPRGKIISDIQTVTKWSTITKPSFTLSFRVYDPSGNNDVRTLVEPIWDLLFPINVKGFGYKAPNNYKHDIAAYASKSKNSSGNYKGAGGTIVVRVGKLFEAPNMVVMDGSVEFSDVDTVDDTPLYADINLTISPAQVVTAEDVKGYFK